MKFITPYTNALAIFEQHKSTSAQDCKPNYASTVSEPLRLNVPSHRQRAFQSPPNDKLRPISDATSAAFSSLSPGLRITWAIVGYLAQFDTGGL